MIISVEIKIRMHNLHKNMITHSKNLVISFRLQLDQTKGLASEFKCGDITCWRSPKGAWQPLCGPSCAMPKL